MRKRLIRNSIFMLAVPIATIIFLARYSHLPKMQLLVVALGAFAQIVVVTFCKKNMRKIFTPDIRMILSSGIERMPAPYEPGKYDHDFKISGIVSMFGSLSPIMAYLAYIYKKEITIPELQILNAKVLNTNFMLLSLFFLIIAPIAFIIWVNVGQVMNIANEGNDNKRYLYRGYAESLIEK